MKATFCTILTLQNMPIQDKENKNKQTERERERQGKARQGKANNLLNQAICPCQREQWDGGNDITSYTHSMKTITRSRTYIDSAVYTYSGQETQTEIPH